MSAFVYAGASQMVALELWRETWSPSTILDVMAVTAIVNARMILMGAAIQPWLAAAPPAQNALNLFFLTDANWLIGTRYQAEGGRDLGILFGAGVALWVVWVARRPCRAIWPARSCASRAASASTSSCRSSSPPCWCRCGRASARPALGRRRRRRARRRRPLMPGYLFIIAGALGGSARRSLPRMTAMGELHRRPGRAVSRDRRHGGRRPISAAPPASC